MASAEAEAFSNFSQAGPPPPSAPVAIRAKDPEELAEQIGPVTPGVRILPTTPRGFDSRVRGWQLGRSAVVSIRVDHAGVWFPRPRDYCGITVPLLGGFEASSSGNVSEFEPGIGCVTEGEDDEIQPQPGSHLLGVNVDAALLESHREALEACWGEAPRPSEWVVRTTTSAGRSLLGYMDWVWRELVQPDSPLHTPRVAREVDDTLARLLAEASAAPQFDDPVVADEAVTRRAEELFAAQLDQPVSIAEVAKAVGVSTRTLSRAFQRRHGMGPATFRQRRRLEAARRDLIDGEPGAVKVTDVALRSGFFHFGRFSVDYRRSFGESPSDTLRS